MIMPHEDRPSLQIVSLDELKQQMRVEENNEDDIITQYGMAAERQIITETRRTQNELCIMGYNEQHDEPATGDVDAQWFPAPLRVAILMLADNLYRNREPVAIGVSVAPIPYTIEVLVKPYVKLVK